MATIARLVLAGKGNTHPGKNSRSTSVVLKKQYSALENLLNAESGKRHFNFLLTPAGFLTFPFPEELKGHSWVELHKQQLINQFQKEAEKQLREFIGDLQPKLKEFTDFLVIGIDSTCWEKDKNGKKKVIMGIELVAVYDTAQKTIHWTGKSYPTNRQKRTLIRIKDIDTHFITLNGQKVLLLDCNDLTAFSPRVIKNTQKDSDIGRIVHPICRKSKKFDPEIVLHLAHSTDTPATWKAKWNRLTELMHDVKLYATGINYSRVEKEPRKDLDSVLQKTSCGDVVNFDVKGREIK